MRRSRSRPPADGFATGQTLTIGEVTAATGLKNAMAARYLARLVDTGRLVATAPAHSKNRAYRRA